MVNVLLQELERFNGVVIFATNLASNFDPAFERRIRAHVLFQMPGTAEREQIWRVQMHPSRTPLAEDVDFRALAEAHACSGGDIRNAVLKAALAAAAEAGADASKRITQQHLDDAIRDVLGAKRVMRQSLFRDDERATGPLDAIGSVEARLQRTLTVAALLGFSALLLALIALVVALLR